MKKRISKPATKNSHYFTFIDVLRVLSALAVVSIHAVLPIESHVSGLPAHQWWFAVGLSSLSRFAVPVFIMISGYLSLHANGQESWSSFYRKRLIRLGIPFFAFIVIYGWWDIITKRDVSLSTYIIKTVVFGNPYGPLYFMYILLGLTVITPFLRVLLQHLSRSKVVGLIALLLGLATCWELCISWFAHTWTFSYMFSTSWFIPYIGYYVLGYYFRKYPVHISPSLLLSVFFGSGLVLTLLNGLFMQRWGANGQGMMLHNYINPLTIVMAASLFLFTLQKQWRVSPFIHRMSALSFGVYLLHQLILELIPPPSLQPLMMTAYIVTVFSLCSVVIFVISKLPVVRYIAGVQ
jgi:surface polysaccharide O-acyltransferase-like enzyme